MKISNRLNASLIGLFLAVGVLAAAAAPVAKPDIDRLVAGGPHPALLPQPAQVEWRAGSFRIGPETSIAAGGFTNEAQFLAGALKLSTRGGEPSHRFDALALRAARVR